MKPEYALRLAIIGLSCLSLTACKSEFANGFLVGAGVTLGVVGTVVIVANSSQANQTGYVSGTSTGRNDYYVPYNRVSGQPYPGSGPTPTPRPTASPSPAKTPVPTPTPSQTPVARPVPSPVPTASSPAIVYTDPTPVPSATASPSPSASAAACAGSDCPVVIIKPATTKDAIIPGF